MLEVARLADTHFLREAETTSAMHRWVCPHSQPTLTILKMTQYSPNCSSLGNCFKPGRELKMDRVVQDNYKGNSGRPRLPVIS